jgi:hypothetical protein
LSRRSRVNIHKPDIALKPMVCYISSSCCDLAGLINKILNLLAEKSGFFVTDSGPIRTVVEICKLLISLALMLSVSSLTYQSMKPDLRYLYSCSYSDMRSQVTENGFF